MPPFVGGLCFIRNERYDIGSENIIDQDSKPIKRKSKWNFLRRLRRKRKAHNTKSEESKPPCQEVVTKEIENEPQSLAKIGNEEIHDHGDRLPNETCVNDTSRLLCVDDKLPSEEFNDSIAKEVLHNCVACGETKLSQKDLVEHLMKHVYEGLNAAVWLSTAMTTLVNNPIGIVDVQTTVNSQYTNVDL